MAERRTWFIRQNGKVHGPFLSAQITRNILLGRLRPDDEISPDKEGWQKVAKHRELYPDVMKDESIDNQKLQIAKMQADERVRDQRREKQHMADERRQAKERRAEESVEILVHRQHRKELDDTFKENRSISKVPVFSILFMVAVITVFGFVLRPKDQNTQANCSLPPAKGVNWSNCIFINLNVENQMLESAILTDATLNQSNLLGANLSGSDLAYAEIIESDLSYANLERSRLIGANLKHSDLRYANLNEADLSYADLSQALLAGANVSNAKFDNAIWVDGQICHKGSIGLCRTDKLNQQ